jgi:hypothetical protein
MLIVLLVEVERVAIIRDSLDACPLGLIRSWESCRTAVRWTQSTWLLFLCAAAEAQYRSMHLLYLDDSGSAKNPNEQYLVLGGLSVFERQTYFLDQELHSLAERINPADPDAVEFHASEIFGGRTHPWKAIRDKLHRKQVLLDVLSVLTHARPGVTAFACAVHKASYPNDDPMEVAFERLCQGFNAMLGRINRNLDAADQQRGMIVLDESAYETTLQSLARGFRRVGTRWGVLRNMAEVPLFVNSRACRCIQLADHIAYAVFRAYECGDFSYLNRVLGKFDQEDGKLHGLVHWQRIDSNCYCAACLSRRLTKSQLP